MDVTNPELPESVMIRVEYWKRVLNDRVWLSGADMNGEEINHMVQDGLIYILANCMITDYTIDEHGNMESYERHNFCFSYQPEILVPFDAAPEYYKRMYTIPNWPTDSGLWKKSGKEMVVVNNPRPYSMMPIPRPYLGVVLDLGTGDLVTDGNETPLKKSMESELNNGN